MDIWKVLVATSSALGCTLWLAACGGSSSPPTALTMLQAKVAGGELPTLDVSSSVTGAHVNSDGVRDDIDTLIAAQTDTPAQKAALTQVAQSIQGTLTLSVSDSTAVTAAATGMRKAIACLFTQYDSTLAAGRFHWIQEISINTMPRLKAYDHFNVAMNNSVAHMATGEVCNA
jgi:hypothetical protein